MNAPSEHRATRPTRVIAVTSGKGGVGKSTVSINLATALAAAGSRVTLLDADLGLANIDVLLGLSATRTLADVIDGACGLRDILLDGPAGVRIVPASSGVQRMAELSDAERVGLMHAFSELEDTMDVMVVDTAAGIAANSLQFCEASQEVVVVVCNDPASIADAYATIKVLNQRTRRARFRVLVNMVHSDHEARDIFARLVKATDRFLEVALDFAGVIPFDRCVVQAARRRAPVVTAYPASPAGTAFKRLAAVADRWPEPRAASGQLEFFLERMIRAEVMGRHALA
ncbi:MAG TPA: MinD/ParA family protein [Gammaproteobacteria bacterium]|nr:MinD/ParA family protein [Gammaproteobacteria bacterium]